MLIDSSKSDDWLARYINDSDCQFKENCRPVQFCDKQSQTNFAFYSTREITAGEELRYNYQCVEAQWKQAAVKSVNVGSIEELKPRKGIKRRG